jgi:hypothetical protein
MLLRRSSAVLVALMLAGLTACGDDEPSSNADGLTDEEQDYVDGALEGFDEEEEAPLTEEDARCIATSMVKAVGVDELEAAGITPESFSSDDEIPEGLEEDQARAIVGGIKGCIDMLELFVEGIAEDTELSEDARACLADQFDDDLVDRLMVTMLTEGEDGLDPSTGVGAEVMQAAFACPEAFGS